jgi:hypothetical protein
MEIHYFFIVTQNGHSSHLAVGRLYSRPDAELLQASYGTYHNVSQMDDTGITVIDVHSIRATVAVIPDRHRPATFFVGEHPGLKTGR